MDNRSQSNTKTTKRIRFNHVGQKLQKQEEFRNMVNSSEQMAFIFITTHSFTDKTISSLFLITNESTNYYVNGHSLSLFYGSALPIQEMKELITETFRHKSVFVYENSGFTLKAIQKHFHIDEQIVTKSKIHNMLAKMRSLFSHEQVQNYSRQTIIKHLGLGFDRLNEIQSKTIPQLWNKRYDSLEFVNIMLAWGMNQILSIKYMAHYAIYRFKKLKMEQQPQSFERLQGLKKENEQLLLKFIQEDLQIQEPLLFFQKMII